MFGKRTAQPGVAVAPRPAPAPAPQPAAAEMRALSSTREPFSARSVMGLVLVEDKRAHAF